METRFEIKRFFRRLFIVLARSGGLDYKGFSPIYIRHILFGLFSENRQTARKIFVKNQYILVARRRGKREQLTLNLIIDRITQLIDQQSVLHRRRISQLRKFDECARRRLKGHPRFACRFES